MTKMSERCITVKNLNEPCYENENIKIEIMSSKEDAEALAKCSTRANESQKKELQLDLENSMEKSKSCFLVKNKENELLGDIFIFPTVPSFKIIGLMIGFHFDKIPIAEYQNIIKFFNSSLDVLGCEKLVVTPISGQHIQQLLDMGFSAIGIKELKNYFEIEMLTMLSACQNVKAFMVLKGKMLIPSKSLNKINETRVPTEYFNLEENKITIRSIGSYKEGEIEYKKLLKNKDWQGNLSELTEKKKHALKYLNFIVKNQDNNICGSAFAVPFYPDLVLLYGLDSSIDKARYKKFVLYFVFFAQQLRINRLIIIANSRCEFLCLKELGFRQIKNTITEDFKIPEAKELIDGQIKTNPIFKINPLNVPTPDLNITISYM